MITTATELARLEKAMLDTYRRELGLALNDADRLQAVYGSSFFEADQVLKLESICATAAQMLEVQNAAVNLISNNQQYSVATHGERWSKSLDLHLPLNVELDYSYCQHVVGTERDLSIEDTLRHALVCESKATTEGGIRSYLGVPIINRQGHILGSLCVWSFQPHKWSATDVALLTSLSAVLTRFEESRGES